MVQFVRIAHAQGLKLHAHRPCRDLCLSRNEHGARISLINEEGDTRKVGNGFLQKAQAFSAQVGVLCRQPVTFAPGRPRLATSPAPTGSASCAMTMGVVPVACLAATLAGVPDVTITSTLSSTSSAARPESWSIFSSANRDSNAMFCPST